MVINPRSKEKSQDRSRPEQGKSSNPIITHEITCFKCKSRRHMARECPNARAMIITPVGDYDSQDKEEVEDVWRSFMLKKESLWSS